MSALKVVCLISGGKDSLFSILHCLANGHEVVALANLHPPYDDSQPAVDDLDSHMYQTVGHSIIPLFEKALGLPLYRQSITGSAINADKSYGLPESHENDETEALVPLLHKVLKNHPEVNAVSTGAILSDYQRTRVESVAVRLGLTPLSFLWQYPFIRSSSHTALLEDMAAVEQDSRIIKVASGGLDDSFLWQNVADSRTISRLDKASKLFGSADDGAVLGEGGEYETLAVTGPSPLWRGRIVVHEDLREIVNGEAGSAFVRLRCADLEMNVGKTIDVMADIPRPALLESEFERILHDLQTSGEGNERDVPISSLLDANGRNSTLAGHHVLQSVAGEGLDAARQMKSIMEQAQIYIQDQGCSWRDVAYTSIILRNMAEFPVINKVYGSYFSHPNPPARATIACAVVVPEGKDLMVSFTFADPASRQWRKGLHVQSRSYWAPANIGPYSQAVSIPGNERSEKETNGVVYIAGQIPLEPASMELPVSDGGDAYSIQAVLALQHAVRVGRIMQVGRMICAIAFIVAGSAEAAIARANVAHLVWNRFHSGVVDRWSDSQDDEIDDDTFDVWDVKYGSAREHTYVSRGFSEDSRQITPPSQVTPPLYVIQVDALPRNATIEWATYGATTGSINPFRIPHFDHLLEVFEGEIILGPRSQP